MPPVMPSLNDVLCPWHTIGRPPIGVGCGFTVTTRLVVQPVGGVYTMVAVPRLTPVTTPPASTEPTAGRVLLQVPPVVASASEVVLPIHICGLPVMGSVGGFTFIGAVTKQPVGKV